MKERKRLKRRLKEICKTNCVVSCKVRFTLKTLIEIISTYNKSMYKNKHIMRANNKINIFYKELLYKNLVPDTSNTKKLLRTKDSMFLK